ncbi:MAG: hypothetical protein C0392_15950 [Syntrophus sp. (in: bacteria)]|nr:hypothetical protein [Syntrophus sp. (in: bacteria)]
MNVQARLKHIENKIGGAGNLPENEKTQIMAIPMDVNGHPDKTLIEAERARRLERLRDKYGDGINENSVLWFIVARISKPVDSGR